jgi:hypothetical protein
VALTSVVRAGAQDAVIREEGVTTQNAGTGVPRLSGVGIEGGVQADKRKT